MKTTGCRPDPVSAASISRNSQNTNTRSSLHKGRTKPTCARCRNHGISIPVKRHKGDCVFRECVCFKCYVVREGGRYRAMQLANWREGEKQEKLKQGEKEKLRKTDRDTSSETVNDKFRETATPYAPGTDSNAVAENEALHSLHGCYSAQNPSTCPEPYAIRNTVPPHQIQHQLTRQYHPNYDSCTPMNAAGNVVDERRELLSSSISISGKTQPIMSSDLQNTPFSTIPHQQLRYRQQISSNTQRLVPTAWMTNHSVTIPPPQSKVQFSIPCGERFTNSGSITSADTLVTDMCSIKSGSDSLSSPGSTSGRTLPIDPSTYTNNASSIIQQQQQYLNFLPACCLNFTNAPTRMTDLLSVIDGSGSASSRSTTNTTVPNVPNVYMHAPGGTIPPPKTETQFPLLCNNGFAPYGPVNNAEDPGTDFHSIDSLSSSSTSSSSRTTPVMNVGCTSIPTQQSVMRQSECSCGNLPSYGAAGTDIRTFLIRQYILNSRFLNGS
jgi:hypothetical protein